MSQQHDDNEDLESALRRMEQEFGQRPPSEGAEDPPPSARPGPPRMVSVPIRPVSRPRATWVILGAIGLMYVASCLLSGSLVQPSLDALIDLGAKENSLIAAGELWRLVAATFLHGNLIHIFFNGYALYALGPENERIYGTLRFLAIYFLAGIGGSVVSYLFSPAPSVGASGAIFGLMGSLGVFFFLNRQVLGQSGRAMVQNIVAIGMINLLIGFASPGVIDNFGHLGGLVAGLVAGFALAPRLALDLGGYQPQVVRRYPPWGWAVVAALAVCLVALAALLPGAGP